MKKLYFILSIVLLAAIAFPVEAATWSTYRIMLDPGHGGSDSGASGPSAPHEATLVLRCAKALKDRIVNECGGTVKMTRTTDTYVSLSARQSAKGSYDPYIFCSLHLNAFNKSAKGTETYYYHSTGNSSLLANKVQPQLIANFKKVSGFTPTNRGVKTANYTVIMGYSGVPAVLTEGLFVDNSTEWSIINSESKQGFKMWVQGHLLGFYDRLVLLNSSITKPGATATTPADTTKPTISRCTTAANDATSFYAYAYATDNVGVTEVKFPTWTENASQDDLVWHVGSKGSWTVGGQSYNYRYLVKTSDHKNETGKYIVHVYAYDAAGNYVSSETSYTFASAKIVSNPTSVTLKAEYGASTKPYVDVTITGTALEADMIYKSSTSGIEVAAQSGWNARTGGKLRFTLNTNFVSGAGEYLEGKYVAVESGSGTAKVRIEIPVAFTLTSSATQEPTKNPAITVSPASLTFSGEEGATIASQKVTVTGTDLSAVPTVSGATDKFTVTSSLTATGGTITVAPKATLAAGTHTGTLTIAATGATSKTVSLTATIKAKQTTNPTPETGTPDMTYGNVKFFLQGGKIDVPADNAALWELFKPDYNTYYTLARADQPITAVTTFAPEKIQDFMTNTKSTWKWLGDHVQKVTTDAGRALDTEVLWRFGVSAFFNCSAAAASTWNGNADFTQAGKPAVWQPMYVIAHKPTKSGATFLGWFTNANATGTALTACPASGSVYACWSGGTTDIENLTSEVVVRSTSNGVELFFEGTAPVAIYNVNGTMISNTITTDYYTCELPTGMYIIRVGNEIVKFIR